MLAQPLQTANLVLKTLEPESLTGDYANWLNDPRVSQFLEIRFAPPQTEESVRSYVRDMNASSDNVLFGMFLAGTTRHIGNIKLGPIDAHHCRADIGLLIGDPQQWGKGFASEAIAAVTEFAFRELKLNKVAAGCYGQNEGSRRAFLRADFTEVARRPRHWRSGEQWVDDVMLERLNPTP